MSILKTISFVPSKHWEVLFLLYVLLEKGAAFFQKGFASTSKVQKPPPRSYQALEISHPTHMAGIRAREMHRQVRVQFVQRSEQQMN